jgi:GTP-binding protein HflX
LAKDLLFATLDPTMRVMTLPHGRRVIISDTVGFISDLPTTLVAAFRATLEEVLSADLILHVRDISHPDTDAQASDVAGVLGELGVDEAKRAAMIEVWNKMDLLPDDDRNALEARSSRSPDCVLVSAVSGEGVSNLLDLIEDRLTSKDSLFRIVIDLEDGRGRAWLHERGEVLACKILEDGRSVLSVRLSAERVSQARERFGRSMRSVEEGELLAE